MIIPIIIILSILLVVLLVDWQAVSKRFPGIGRALEARKQARPAPVRREVVRQVVKHTEQDLFSSQPQVQEKKPVEPVIEEPKPVSAVPEVQELIQEADVFFRKGEYKAAEQKYLQAAAKDPRCSKAYSRLGVIYLETGEDWQDAEAAFRQALKTDADNGYILNNLGLVLYHQDKYADAIRQFELAVRQDEMNGNRHANLGKAYMAMRQYAKAESAFKKALKLAPSELEYKDLLAEAMEKKIAHKALIRR